VVGFKNKDQRTTYHLAFINASYGKVSEIYEIMPCKSKIPWSAPIRLCLIASRVHVFSPLFIMVPCLNAQPSLQSCILHKEVQAAAYLLTLNNLLSLPNSLVFYFSKSTNLSKAYIPNVAIGNSSSIEARHLRRTFQFLNIILLRGAFTHSRISHYL